MSSALLSIIHAYSTGKGQWGASLLTELAWAGGWGSKEEDREIDREGSLNRGTEGERKGWGQRERYKSCKKNGR